MSKPPKARSSGPRGDLSEVSLDWLESTDPSLRKGRGQYLTPRPVAEALLDRVTVRPGMRILDPGVGTGELLRAALDREPALDAVGWDIDETAVSAARKLVPEATIEVRSALDPVEQRSAGGDVGAEGGGFDLVVANPPYFQLRLEPSDRQRFAGVISGRANVFALFFQVALDQLRPDGTLAFIVPPSMNSGAYFESLREHLISRAAIEDLTLLDGTDIFEGANTAIQLLVLKKLEPPVGRIPRERAENPTHREFVFRREVGDAGFRRVVFSPDPDRLAAEFAGRRTIWELGLEAVTGQVIWNENRSRLVARPGPDRVRLIWSHSIGEGELRARRDGSSKPGYYDLRESGRAPLTGPAIVVNRVVGAVGRGELRAALVPEGEPFLAENHVNVIRPREPGISGGAGVDWERVLASLRAPGVVERLRILTGNTQISARELTHLLPIDP